MTGEEPRMPRDEDVRKAWQAASDELPPSRVDAAILEAARDAAQRPAHGDGARRARPWYREWQPMLAAAAIAGLAFALVQTMPSDDRVAMPLGAPASTGARPWLQATVQRWEFAWSISYSPRAGASPGIRRACSAPDERPYLPR
jgi:hypothetical protein